MLFLEDKGVQKVEINEDKTKKEDPIITTIKFKILECWK